MSPCCPECERLLAAWKATSVAHNTIRRAYDADRNAAAYVAVTTAYATYLAAWTAYRAHRETHGGEQ